jgi:ABC-type multidrug transport system permease subunit
MSDLTEQEIKEAADSLVGVRIWFIVEIVLYSIATLTLLILSIVIPIVVASSGSNTAGIVGSLAGLLIGFIIVAVLLILFITALLAISKRRKNSYQFMMAMLIISMFWVPVGTIVGAILLTRINNKLTKKYLNYI